MTTKWEVRQSETNPDHWYAWENNPKKSAWRQRIYRFVNNAAAEGYAEARNAELAMAEAKKAERRAEKKAARAKALANLKAPFFVGQIFRHSWGYDQTNVEFYEIVEVGAKSVVLREIAGETVPGTEGFMSCKVAPSPGKFVGAPFRKVAQVMVKSDGSGEAYLPVEHGWMSPMNPGETTYCSWYA